MDPYLLHYSFHEPGTSDLESSGEWDNIRKGARLLKIFVSGGLSSNTSIEDCPFHLPELRKASQLAHEHGIPTTAHATSGRGIDLALEAGNR